MAIAMFCIQSVHAQPDKTESSSRRAEKNQQGMMLLNSKMQKGGAVKLSIAAENGIVSIDLGDGNLLEKEVSAEVNNPTFLQLDAPVDNPTITIKGNVLGIECSSLQLSSPNAYRTVAEV